LIDSYVELGYEAIILLYAHWTYMLLLILLHTNK